MTQQRNTKPKVSIVIPTYNREKFLHQSIDSCLKQTLKDWELIIVNDASTDNTSEILKKYAAKDPRIHIYKNEKNKKLPGTLNVGFKHAQGKYWMWMGDDDFLEPNALAVMSKTLDQNPEIALVYTDYTVTNEQDEAIWTTSQKEPAYLIAEDVVGICRMYRADIAKKIGEYREDLFMVEDYEFFLRMGINHKFMHIPGSYYRFCVHSDSLTGSKQKEIHAKDAQVRAMYLKQYPPLTLQQQSLIHLNNWARNKVLWDEFFKGFIKAPLFFLHNFYAIIRYKLCRERMKQKS